MPRVVHFDIDAGNPEQLIGFYGKIFGWKFNKWDGPMDYWLISTGQEEGGIDGGLGRRGPESMKMNTIGVPSVDEYVARVTESGGTIIMPKMAIPGIGWFAVFKDPEDNLFGLMENDPEAK